MATPTDEDFHKDKFIPLNLPPVDYSLRTVGKQLQIYDPFRKKYVVLTPEEWVRQHFLQYLQNHLHYPQGAIAVEVPIAHSLRADRVDAIVFVRGGKPAMLLEFKAPQVSLSADVVRQIGRYNLYFSAPVLVLSNGLKHFAFLSDQGRGDFEPISHIPSFQDLCLFIDTGHL